jgi:hypothetical protein
MVSSTDFNGRHGRRRFCGCDRARPLLPSRQRRPGQDSSRRTIPRLYVHVLAKPSLANGRIGYHYNNTAVQSQHIATTIDRLGRFEIITDFTLSYDLTHLESFPAHPRINVLTNAKGDDTHQIVLRQ